jgi:hypothetical protein
MLTGAVEVVVVVVVVVVDAMHKLTVGTVASCY